jgi:hypothetical protein
MSRDNLILLLNSKYQFDKQINLEGYVLPEFSSIEYVKLFDNFDINLDLSVDISIFTPKKNPNHHFEIIRFDKSKSNFSNKIVLNKYNPEKVVSEPKSSTIKDDADYLLALKLQEQEYKQHKMPKMPKGYKEYKFEAEPEPDLKPQSNLKSKIIDSSAMKKFKKDVLDDLHKKVEYNDDLIKKFKSQQEDFSKRFKSLGKNPKVEVVKIFGDNIKDKKALEEKVIKKVKKAIKEINKDPVANPEKLKKKKSSKKGDPNMKIKTKKKGTTKSKKNAKFEESVTDLLFSDSPIEYKSEDEEEDFILLSPIVYDSEVEILDKN